MENLNSNKKQTLLGCRIQIELEAIDKEALEKLRRSIPEMPIVAGTFIKRFYAANWGYVVELDEPLSLDREGVSLEARKRYSTKYLMVKMSLTDRNGGKDPLHLELTGKEPDTTRGNYRKGESHAWVGCITDSSSVPSEVDKNDRFWKDNPVMCTGWVKLID